MLMLTLLLAGVVLRTPPLFRTVMSYTLISQPAVCRIRMRANVAEPEAYDTCSHTRPHFFPLSFSFFLDASF